MTIPITTLNHQNDGGIDEDEDDDDDEQSDRDF